MKINKLDDDDEDSYSADMSMLQQHAHCTSTYIYQHYMSSTVTVQPSSQHFH